MPRSCAIVIIRAASRGGKKSAGRIKQAAMPCVKRDRRMCICVKIYACKKTGAVKAPASLHGYN
jgi:hypothetical protein